MALSSSPRNVFEWKQKIQNKAAKSADKVVLSKSAPVSIPSKRVSISHSYGESGTPREHGLEDRVSRKLSNLVGPVRPASYKSPKTVGFEAYENALTRPIMSTGHLDDKERGRSLSEGQSVTSSLLTKALSGENHTDVAQKDMPSERSSGFVSQQEKFLAETLQEKHEIFGAPLVKLAFELARSAHYGQMRKNGESYLSHLVETADILAKLGLDEQTVAAGILHDILDDTMMTQQQLNEYIPSEVVDMVVGVSRMSQVSQLNRDHIGFDKEDPITQSDRFRNMLLSMADVRVVLIKLADRLHNMRTLNALSPEKQRTIAEETLHVFVPLANRLGVWSIKAELEDLCFKYLNHSEFLKLQNYLKDDFMKNQKKKLQKNLDILQRALKNEKLDCKDLHGRPKNIYGIHKKMQKKGITFEEVYDLCACRIIVQSKKECYEALELVHSIWKPMDGKIKNYIKNPKANGYQSLHTVVLDEDGRPFEIQIRTAEMHFMAEFGVAAHWQYKESHMQGKKNKKVEQQIAWNRWLLTWQMELQDRKYRPTGSPDQEPKDVMFSFPDEEPAPPLESHYDPIYALISTKGNVTVREVPANCTLNELSKEILKVNPGTQFLVNQEYQHPEDYTVKMGDLVELVQADYFEDEFEIDAYESEDEGAFDLFDFERQKLDKMYNEWDYFHPTSEDSVIA